MSRAWIKYGVEESARLALMVAWEDWHEVTGEACCVQGLFPPGHPVMTAIPFEDPAAVPAAAPAPASRGRARGGRRGRGRARGEGLVAPAGPAPDVGAEGVGHAPEPHDAAVSESSNPDTDDMQSSDPPSDSSSSGE